MKRELLQEIKNAFPDKFVNSKNFYKLTLDDLNVLFDIGNRIIFNNKLNRDLVEISFYIDNKSKDYGQFALGSEGTNKCIIRIQEFANGNRFDRTVSVIYHEMIHMYDRYHGELNKILNDKDYMFVTSLNGEQLVDTYQVHGKYFMNWANKFSRFGIIIKVKYDQIERNAYMNKLKESFEFFKNEILEESDVTDDLEYRQHLQNVYDSLAGCPNKEFKYYDKEHWYIRID